MAIRNLNPETTESIYKWGLETFGEAQDPAVYIGRALQEFAELVELVDINHDEAPFEFCDLMEELNETPVQLLEYIALAIKQGGTLRNREEAPAECADVRIVLEHVNGELGVDGSDEVDKKMAINRERRWKKSEDGTSTHIKD